jgi:hypothetical protein
MSKKLLILGAGADRTTGIEFPMANTLLPAITQYLEGEGKAVDEALRDALPGLRFKFIRLINHAIDNLTNREIGELKSVIGRVQIVVDSIADDDSIVKKQGMLIIRLFNKLVGVATESQIDDITFNLIKDVFPENANEIDSHDSIVDIHKLPLSETFKSIFKSTLKQSLTTSSNEVANALGMDMLDVEKLLIDKFLGFYNNKSSEIKNYIYISWCLWAFLVHRQNKVLETYNSSSLPFYENIPAGIKAITLNYTSFLEITLGRDNCVYFHGGLAEYVSMDTRNLIPIENIVGCDPAQLINSEISSNIDVTDDNTENQKHVIPALVPPLRLKPILSHKYIELWHRASEWVQNADKIVVVGYSFNAADEHFNDIMRVNNGKKFDIVGPAVHDSGFIVRIEKVLHVPSGNWTNCSIQNLPAKKAGNVRLIKANADEVNLENLFAD